ncbi:MAG: TonB-dependent receptor, partial [Gemmatimonadales bacterium]
VQFYGGYSESNRAPSPVELTCADPDDPCRLPNAFLSDPPLEQVVAKSWEAGVRGSATSIDWHLGLFRTTNEDDIIFISAGALTNEGFFDNVGDTRREGVELNLNGRLLDQRLDWFVNYTYLDAMFREDFVVASPNNPAAVDGEIPVESGDRLPGIPEELLKAGATIAVTPELSLSVGLTYSSDQYFRGDEGNLVEPVSSYTVVNLHGEYRFNEHASVFVKVDNLFDEEYETFGLFGEADEVLGDEFDDPRFLSPAAERAGWIGVRLAL